MAYGYARKEAKIRRIRRWIANLGKNWFAERVCPGCGAFIIYARAGVLDRCRAVYALNAEPVDMTKVDVTSNEASIFASDRAYQDAEPEFFVFTPGWGFQPWVDGITKDDTALEVHYCALNTPQPLSRRNRWDWLGFGPSDRRHESPRNPLGGSPSSGGGVTQLQSLFDE